MNDRVRYRDFYDFTMILKKIGVDLDEVLDLMRIKEIRQPIIKQNILNNWDLAKQEKIKDFTTIQYTEELDSDAIKRELEKLSFDKIMG